MKTDDTDAVLFVAGIFASAMFFFSYMISKQPEPYRIPRPLAKVIIFPKRA